MKRTVKAWLMLLDGGLPNADLMVETRKQFAERGGQPSDKRWTYVPCTITYDDGKPARKKGKR